MPARAAAPELDRIGNGRVPDLAIESVARGFFREANLYGFAQADILRFVNSVLGLSMATIGANGSGMTAKVRAARPANDEPAIELIDFDPAEHRAIVAGWLEDGQGAHFLRPGTTLHPVPLDDVIGDDSSVLGIITLPDGKPIGATAYLHVDRLQRRAEMRKLIGDPGMRGRGYGKAATRRWVSFGFETLRLHKIYITTLDTNLRNIRLNEALGFRLEGILHDEVLIDGRYHDVLRMAIWDETGRPGAGES